MTPAMRLAFLTAAFLLAYFFAAFCFLGVLSFNEFHTVFNQMDTIFLQSKKTGRWWMQLPDKKMIACSYKDYLNASNNEIPERWLRAQERS